ncbi:hypothetical protein CEXT_601211 [Caerostris extrusa]|uniref:Uncharacterized protein n=1 Tax=Caerostris extrusa TaxID=172846 RepID=A0AAV4RND5_CAEEX|nr:hypothetical protein CEXT_601211 [Caerostris extrusa]
MTATANIGREVPTVHQDQPRIAIRWTPKLAPVGIHSVRFSFVRFRGGHFIRCHVLCRMKSNNHYGTHVALSMFGDEWVSNGYIVGALGIRAVQKSLVNGIETNEHVH